MNIRTAEMALANNIYDTFHQWKANGVGSGLPVPVTRLRLEYHFFTNHCGTAVQDLVHCLTQMGCARASSTNVSLFSHSLLLTYL